MRLLLNTSNVVELNNVRALGETVSDAAVEATIYDRNLSPVLGQVWPLQLQSVAPGSYRATASADLTLERGALYTVVVTAVAADTKKRTWEIETTAQADKVF